MPRCVFLQEQIFSTGALRTMTCFNTIFCSNEYKCAVVYKLTEQHTKLNSLVL